MQLVEGVAPGEEGASDREGAAQQQPANPVAGTAGGDERTDDREGERDELEQQVLDPGLLWRRPAKDRGEPQREDHQGDDDRQDCPWSPALACGGHALPVGAACWHAALASLPHVTLLACRLAGDRPENVTGNASLRSEPMHSCHRQRRPVPWWLTAKRPHVEPMQGPCGQTDRL
jgi:hypothetical protein